MNRVKTLFQQSVTRHRSFYQLEAENMLFLAAYVDVLETQIDRIQQQQQNNNNNNNTKKSNWFEDHFLPVWLKYPTSCIQQVRFLCTCVHACSTCLTKVNAVGNTFCKQNKEEERSISWDKSRVLVSIAECTQQITLGWVDTQYCLHVLWNRYTNKHHHPKKASITLQEVWKSSETKRLEKELEEIVHLTQLEKKAHLESVQSEIQQTNDVIAQTLHLSLSMDLSATSPSKRKQDPSWISPSAFVPFLSLHFKHSHPAFLVDKQEQFMYLCTHIVFTESHYTTQQQQQQPSSFLLKWKDTVWMPVFKSWLHEFMTHYIKKNKHEDRIQVNLEVILEIALCVMYLEDDDTWMHTEEHPLYDVYHWLIMYEPHTTLGYTSVLSSTPNCFGVHYKLHSDYHTHLLIVLFLCLMDKKVHLSSSSSSSSYSSISSSKDTC